MMAGGGVVWGMRISLLAAWLSWVGLAVSAGAEPLRFNRDIRPILSENCFHCHGQDASKRKGELRLDSWEGATAAREEGAALVPGKPEESVLLQRLESSDAEEQMPPPTSHRRVSREQIALVRQWIGEGGSYEKHWAFVPPERAALPAAAAWDREPWDGWVRQGLAREQLEPTAEATPSAWLRRASFDLTGLAPSLGELDAFAAAVGARGESAYREEAERLLGSPRYGERMAAEWLDVARYADTHGFNNDSMRSMWRWRDWVIGAFNRNLSYDQFITKQLAGDLLPGAGLEDRLATGYGRNHVINSEGGIIDEEYRVEYVADRVRTLGMSWLGLTMECSRCHDHKYDPVTAKDYYRLYAFFNQVPEWGEDGRVGNAAPLLAAPTEEQVEALRVLEGRMEVARREMPKGEVEGRPLGEVVDWLRGELGEVAEPSGAVLRVERRGEQWVNGEKPELALGSGVRVKEDAALGAVMAFPNEGGPLETGHFAAGSQQPWTWQAAVRWEGGAGVLLSNMDYEVVESSSSHGQGLEVRVTESGGVEVRVAQKWPAYAIQLESTERIRPGCWQQIAVVNGGKDQAAGWRIYLDGKESGVVVRHDGLTGGVGAKGLRMGSAKGAKPDVFRGEWAEVRAWPRALGAEELADLADGVFGRLLRGPTGMAEAMGQLERLQAVMRRHQRGTAAGERALRGLEAERFEMRRGFPSVMVMEELAELRATHVLGRGRYDAPGEVVTAGVPEELLGAWPEGAPKNRLGLARWLTQPQHPLTARVVVNRFWQQVFGVGLVKTSEDFGFQSEYPPHPELLDWLARDFVEGGWNVKGLMRSLVLSATYRQDSRVSADLVARDPENRWLGRGPRLRLAAEMIRDHALAVSGLLRERLGGPSVFPDQPEDLYKGVVVDAAYPGTKWVVSAGEERYRRSLYTFWKRTVPHPVMNVFDVPDRESGCVRRSRTNTPLQALALMNEPALLRAAGHLGQRMQVEGGEGDAARVGWGFRLATGRVPSAREEAVLVQLLADLRQSYAGDAAGAAAMLKSGDVEARAEGAGEAAAWTALASNVLNLDETITKN